jgi:nucleoid-associated protein YgaU
MPEENKPDYAPKNYEMPKMDFSDAKLEKPAETKPKTYTVDSGDNLSNIAKQELGDANRWREIYELNKDVIGKNPDLIQPGMELKLPS